MQAYSPLSAFCSDCYRGIPASAASNNDAAFFVHNTDLCVNFKINTAMLKNNNSIVPGAYVSPAVKWVNARTRGVYAASPYGKDGEAGNQGSLFDNENEEDF